MCVRRAVIGVPAVSDAVEFPLLRPGCIVPRVSATKVAPHHPNPGNAAAQWMRRATHHPPPPDRTGGRAGSSTPRACGRYRAPPHGSSVARPPGQDQQWVATRAHVVQGGRGRVHPSGSRLASFPRSLHAGSGARARECDPLGLLHRADRVPCEPVRFPTRHRHGSWSGGA